MLQGAEDGSGTCKPTLGTFLHILEQMAGVEGFITALRRQGRGREVSVRVSEASLIHTSMPG